MEWVCAFLGNPGNKYSDTRHNIAWKVADLLEGQMSLSWGQKFKGLFSKASNNETTVYFIKPQTYMNLSGESVIPMGQFFKIPPQNYIVVHDELDLPFGTIALKKGGGIAGHNGLKSIVQHSGTQDFFRLRIGIGRPKTPMDIADYVLSNFSQDEVISLDLYLKEIAKCLNYFFEFGPEKAIAEYKKKVVLS